MPQQPEIEPPTEKKTDSEADEHLAQLHRMSTTAGVTNLDYVAVNLVAITAVLLGLASALALLDKLLLVIPLAGIVFALVAIRQVNNSGGTQTGRGLAIGGLVLCLLFGGIEVVKEIKQITSVREDERQVAEALSEVGKLIREKKYEEAYALFDDSFHSYVKPDEFKNTLIGLQGSVLGPLESMEGNGLVQFESAGGTRVAGTKAKIKFAKTREADRFDVALRQVNGKWLILRFPFFQEPKPGSKNDDFNI